MSERSPYTIELTPGRIVWTAWVRSRDVSRAGGNEATLFALSKARALRRARRWCSRHSKRERAHREAGPYIYEFDPEKEPSDV